jgi:PAP2 superfamily
VNGVDARYERHLSTLSDPSADAEAAAAHKELVNFFPANQAALDAELANSLSMIPDGPAKTAGVALGAAIGQEAFDARLNDGFSSVAPFVPPVGVGFWKPTPPVFAPIVEPQFQNVTPFGIESRDQFKVKTKQALILTHAKYAAEFNEVKEIGRIDSTTRTADQTHYAHFWFEGSQLGWSKIANIISINENYDLHETARLLALVHMSMCDGFIAGWYWKRVHAFWRPVTAIHEADTDGNPETIQDAGWNSLRPTPASPDYPSTHSVLGAAAAEILRRFTGTDAFPFCMDSTTAVPAGTQRCWRSFTQAELENAESRVLVGFHFRFAIETGVSVGRKVGGFAARHALRPLE